MVNPNIQGKRYPRSATYLVGREKIREFARATFATEESIDLVAAEAAGHRDLVAPPTFPIVLQEFGLKLVIADPEAGLDFSRVVHGEQKFVFKRPIVAGDLLTSELSVASVKSLGGNHMVVFDTEIFDESNSLVCTAISTLVVRGEDA
jgi:acyl dehydratase|tara:strand:+ start:187 stop:630 length:444 start_codon:yes stop_codon:yes gene_type:complete